MESKVNEIMQKAMEQIDKWGTTMYPMCINKTINTSPVDKALEKEIKRIANENGIYVQFETKTHKVQTIVGYTRVGNRPVGDTYINKHRIMWATKIA